MREKGYHEYEIVKADNQIKEGGFNLDMHLIQIGQQTEIDTSAGHFKIEKREDGYYLSGDYPLSSEPKLVELYGFRTINNEPEKLEHNYFTKDSEIKILIPGTNQEYSLGKVLKYELPKY